MTDSAMAPGAPKAARPWRAFLRRFFGDRTGNIAMMFGLAAIPFFSAAGMAVDYARAFEVKSRLVNALDATALAMGSQLDLSQTQLRAIAQKYFDANYPAAELGTPGSLNISFGTGTVSISASAEVETAVMGLIGVNSLSVAADVTVKRSATNLEISLVLDVTGSMVGDKVEDLKLAANDLVDILVQNTQTPFFSKVAIVPYSMAVNVGTRAAGIRGAITRPGSRTITSINKASNATVTSNGHGYLNGERVYISGVSGISGINNRFYTVSNRTANNFQIGISTSSSGTGGTAACASPVCLTQTFANSQGGIKVHSLSTCVTERIGTNAYTDAAPATALFMPNYPVSTNPCLTPQLVPLTSDRTVLHNAINALQAGGSTGGHIGIAWGWYTLSPNFATTFPGLGAPAGYGTNNLSKIAVIMTDGEYNSSYCQGIISQDSTNGSGNAQDHINCNATNGHSFNQATTLCTAMKARGITVYTIGFDLVDDQRARDLVNNCATDADHVKMADNGDDLRAVFREIAIEISNLRISQ